MLARDWMSSGRVREAQTLARRERDMEPLREAGWRLLFETIIAGSDSVSAKLEAAAFEQLVATEEIVPEPATRALLRTLRHSPEPNELTRAPSGSALSAELVGREREFADVLAAWETARTGKSAHVHVVAAAGLGKTRLLNDAAARLRAMRARIVVVRAPIGTRDIPFGLAGPGVVP